MRFSGRIAWTSRAGRVEPVPVAARVALALLDRRALLWLLWLIAGGLLLIVALMGGVAAVQQSSSSATAGPSSLALADIPAAYLGAYEAAGAKYGIDWAILAGIGEVECDHGRNPDPSCSVPGAENSAGAGGPMQFLAATWAQYGVTPSGQPAPAAGRWNYLDAIDSAANYLRASGAPGDYYHAIWVYNHAGWYVSEVESWAAKYRAAAATAIPVGTVVPGSVARIDPSSGDAIPAAGEPPVVQQMILAGDRIINTSYSTERTAEMLTSVMGSYDCSGSTDFILYNAGLGGPDVDVGGGVAGDSSLLESWGAPGPGKWVTVFANSGHAFIEVAGIVMDTAWYAPVQPSSPSSGPRWQPASIIPAQIGGDQYGGFVERHPPGL